MDGGFRRFARLFQRLGKVAVGACVLRLQAGGLVQVCQGLFQAVAEEVQFSPVVDGLEFGGAQPDRFVQAGFGLVYAVFVKQGDSLAYPGVGVGGVQFDGLVEVGDGSPRVVGLEDALVPHQVIFVGVFLQVLLLFPQLFFQPAVLFFQAADDAQLLADEPLYQRLFDVVPAVYGFEEVVQECREVGLVEGFDGRDVLFVGLCLLQGPFYGLAVVEPLREGDDFRPHEDIGTADFPFQLDAFQRGAAAQGDVGLSAGKDASGKVDDRPVEGQPLTFVYRDGPGQPDGVLGEGAQLFFFYFLLLLVVPVAYVAPAFAFHLVFRPVFGAYIEGVLVGDAHNGSDGPVHPPFFGVVLDEDNLGTGFHHQFHQGRQAVFGEFTVYLSFQRHRFFLQSGQLLLVDVVYRVSPGGQRDVQVVFVRADRSLVAGIQQQEVPLLHGVGPDAVQDADEHRVRLPVDLGQLDGHQFHLLEDGGREEIRVRIEPVQDFAFLVLHHRLQLEDVSHQQHLFPAERLTHVLRVGAQNLVDEVDDVGTYHRNLVDDDQLQVLDEFPVVGAVFQEVVEFAALKAGVVRQERVKRQFEETVQGTPSGVDGRDSGRCQDHVFFPGHLADMLQKGRFAGSCLSRQEDGLAGVLNQFQGILKFRIVGIDGSLCHKNRLSPAKIRINRQ